MVSEEITLEGHIIDSLVLTKVLDDIMAFGGDFRMLEVHVGQSRQDRSHARLEVFSETEEKLESLLHQLSKHGALVRTVSNALLQHAEVDGAFPEDFFVTTNHQTFVRHDDEWLEVEDQEMDCGILFDADKSCFRCIPVTKVRTGDSIVCGHRGVKVVPLERQRPRGEFEFLASEISTEKPKNAIIKLVARLMRENRESGKKLLLVGGPAIVHTGSVEHVVKLINRGYVQVLVGGNALATHDIEYALYGTSLGVYIDKAILADTGHEHTIRAINAVRRIGGIARGVESGLIKTGIMHACVRNNVEYVLTGTIRDDGPLPDVLTEMLTGQDRIRAAAKGVGFALMVASALHSIAVANLLPARIPAVCVDINPTVLTKLNERGSQQTICLVTDVEPFFRELVQEIELLEKSAGAAE